MKLKDYIKTHKGQLIYLGMATSFVYIGNSNVKDINFESELAYKNLEERIVKYKRKITAIENRKDKVEADFITLEKFKVALENTIANKDNFIPFMERNVKEVYKLKTVPNNALAVVCEGEEIGSYWFIDEYERAKECRTKKDTSKK